MKLSAGTSRWIVALFLLLAVASIAINAFVGLFNSQTIRWNGDMLSPDIDHAPQYLFNWRYPQFLANEELICSRNRDYFETSLITQHIALTPYKPGHVITPHEAQRAMRIAPAPNWFLPANWNNQNRFESKKIASANLIFLPAIVRRWPIAAVFVGMAYQYGETVDTRCHPVSIVLGPAELAGEEQDWVLKVQMGAIIPDNIYVSLNGAPPEALIINRQSLVGELPVNSMILLPDKPNWISFYFSDPELSDPEINQNTPPSIKSISIEAVD
jgi:hypothetical protein